MIISMNKNDYKHDKVRTFSMRNHDRWYIMQVLTTFFYKVRKFSMSNHDRWYIMHFLTFFFKCQLRCINVINSKLYSFSLSFAHYEIFINSLFCLLQNLYYPKLPSCWNQSIDLLRKSIDWFLYDDKFGV